jgi:hypothetical protein
MAFSCMRCGAFVPIRQGPGRVLCERCRELEAAAEEKREHRRRIVGRQPFVCQGCSRPFTASRLGHRFCSASCRARFWREHRESEASTTARVPVAAGPRSHNLVERLRERGPARTTLALRLPLSVRQARRSQTATLVRRTRRAPRMRAMPTVANPSTLPAPTTAARQSKPFVLPTLRKS